MSLSKKHTLYRKARQEYKAFNMPTDLRSKNKAKVKKLRMFLQVSYFLELFHYVVIKKLDVILNFQRWMKISQLE